MSVSTVVLPTAIAQAAAEYGALSSGSASAAQGTRPLTPERLLEALPGDPVIIGAAILGLLLLIGLFRTRRYRA